MVVIHSLTHNLLLLLCNSQSVVGKIIGETIRDMVVIHSLIYNQHVLLCNSHTVVEKMIGGKNKRWLFIS